MGDRTEILEATLDSLPEGITVLGEQCEVVFWNRAAEAITGYAGIELLGRPSPEALRTLLHGRELADTADSDAGPARNHDCIVHTTHKLGHQLSTMTRTLALRDGLGTRIGTAVLFHPAESLDALPHGDSGESERVETSQAELKDRMESFFEDFSRGGLPFGVLWITVDQAAGLRKTHGAGACEAMLEKVARALTLGLRPSEHLARWGQDEFLVISHERTPAMLADHAQTLAGLARTADFRWWGDRISLTVSIGAAQVEQPETLAELLERAKSSMLASFQAGGNKIASAPRRQSCSPS